MSGPVISDHALVRFLERAGGFDYEPLKARLSQSLARGYRAARSISAADFLVKVDGMVFVIRADTVVTVLPDDHSGTPGAALKGGSAR